VRNILNFLAPNFTLTKDAGMIVASDVRQWNYRSQTQIDSARVW